MKKFSVSIILILIVIFFSIASLLKLGGIGDGDPIMTPLRLLNRNDILLGTAILLIIAYLWKKDK
ncbi:MAG TPA: hypothetical protein VJ028_01345 [Patescibacteria group bacterium]|nr:hypothetical protein [Patescibacteria group bacterium]